MTMRQFVALDPPTGEVRVVTLPEASPTRAGLETAEQAALYNAFLQDRFGDGSDGTVTVSAPLTLVRDMYYDTLTVAAGAQIATQGNTIFCKTLLDLSNAPAAAIVGCAATLDGNAATGGSTGGVVRTGSPAGESYARGGTGIQGASGLVGAGVVGTTGSASVSEGSAGGAGGASGSGTGGAGAAGGPTLSHVISRPHRFRVKTCGMTAPNFQSMLGGAQPGAGGAAGAGDGAAAKGGGGGSGGGTAAPVAISAKTILRGAGTAAGCIRARGGAGGNGGNGAASANNTGGGGGGGAGGGTAARIGYFARTGAAAATCVDAGGGAGGNGGNGVNAGGGGTGGSGGDAGCLILDDYATGVTTVTTGTAGSAAAAPVGAAGSAGGAGGVLITGF